MARLALSVVYFCNLYFFDAVNRISFLLETVFLRLNEDEDGAV